VESWRELRQDGKKNRARISVGKVAKETRKDEPQLREQRDTYPLSMNRIIKPGSDLQSCSGRNRTQSSALLELDRCRHLKSVNWRSTAMIVSKMDNKSSVLD